MVLFASARQNAKSEPIFTRAVVFRHPKRAALARDIPAALCQVLAPVSAVAAVADAVNCRRGRRSTLPSPQRAQTRQEGRGWLPSAAAAGCAARAAREHSRVGARKRSGSERLGRGVAAAADAPEYLGRIPAANVSGLIPERPPRRGTADVPAPRAHGWARSSPLLYSQRPRGRR